MRLYKNIGTEAGTALAIDIARKKLCIIRAAADSSLHGKVWRREQILGAYREVRDRLKRLIEERLASRESPSQAGV